MLSGAKSLSIVLSKLVATFGVDGMCYGLCQCFCLRRIDMVGRRKPTLVSRKLSTVYLWR